MYRVMVIYKYRKITNRKGKFKMTNFNGGLKTAGELIATTRGEEQMNIINDALKHYTWEQINEAVKEAKEKQS